MAITNKVLEMRVQRGAALLDTVVGWGWEERVDLDRLDMDSPTACVAGQIFGRFSIFYESDGVREYMKTTFGNAGKHDDRWSDIEHCGFWVSATSRFRQGYVAPSVHRAWSLAHYSRLTEIWKRVISARRVAA